MKTRNLFIMLGVIVVVLVAIILVLNQYVFLSFRGMNGPTVQTYTSLVSETGSSYTYRASFVGSPEGATCTTSEVVDIYFGFSPSAADESLQAPPEDIQFGVRFETSDVQLNGLIATSNPCISTLAKQEDFIIQNLTAECSVERRIVTHYYTVPGGIVCYVRGKAFAKSGIPIQISGLNGGAIVVEVLKQGIECTLSQTTLCDLNEECVMSVCQEVIPVPPTPPIPTLSLGERFANIWNSIKDWFSRVFG